MWSEGVGIVGFCNSSLARVGGYEINAGFGACDGLGLVRFYLIVFVIHCGMPRLAWRCFFSCLAGSRVYLFLCS
jgi:hypothetical protein